jgi:uncharacterized protein
MQDNQPRAVNLVVIVAALEGGLAIVALGLGWLFDIRPMESFHWSLSGVGWGLLGTLPPLMLLAIFLHLSWKPFRETRQLLNDIILPFFRECGLHEIAVIALLAGLSEELLFRPIVQGGLAGLFASHPLLGTILGLTSAAIIFGLLHGVTLTYAILAGLIGLYLGAVWLLTDNLLAPITIHALYDFIAIAVMLKLNKNPRSAGVPPAL